MLKSFRAATDEQIVDRDRLRTMSKQMINVRQVLGSRVVLIIGTTTLKV